MAEIIKNNQPSLNESHSWVLSLPFFPELLKRIKIILLIHLTNKKNLFRSIRNQRINAVNKIIRAFKNFKLINQIKREYFLRKIITDRKKSIIKIQRQVKYYLNRLLLKKILRLENGCYTIICNKTNVAKISIKIFTDYKDSDQCSVWPMRFCPIRKYFFFPIPKTKFVLAKKNNKIVNFNFIHNGNIFYCDCYKIIDFNGKKVHSVNFSNLDIIEENNRTKEIIKAFNNDNCNCNSLSYKTKRQKSSLLVQKNKIIDFSSDEEEVKKSSRKTSKDLFENKKQKFKRRNKKNKTCKISKLRFLKIAPILKERNLERKNRRSYSIAERHVQFGTVTFSY